MSDYEDGYLKGKEHAIDLIFEALKKLPMDDMCWCSECFDRNRHKVMVEANLISSKQSHWDKKEEPIPYPLHPFAQEAIKAELKLHLIQLEFLSFLATMLRKEASQSWLFQLTLDKNRARRETEEKGLIDVDE